MASLNDAIGFVDWFDSWINQQLIYVCLYVCIQNSYVWPRKALEPAGRIVNYSTTAWSPSRRTQLYLSVFSTREDVYGGTRW